MKAYHIMMFLLLFNLFFWTVTAGMGLFDIGIGTDAGFDLSDEAENPTNIGMGIIGVFTLFHDVASSMIGLGIAIASGAMIGYLTAGQGAAGLVYGLFGYFFWSATSHTFTVLYNISNASGTVLYVLIIFGMIIGIVFAVGLFQMVTGGWKSVE